MNTAALHCTHIDAGYHKTRVLHRVNFTAHAGECVAVLGPNGSGKSTLLNTLSGALIPWSGHIFLQNIPLATLAPRMRAQHMAVVPQKLDGLPTMKVWDMVLLGRYPHKHWWGLYRESDYTAAESALADVDALTLRHKFLHELSGGELQRVLLARALAQETHILLLDELSSGLDMARMAELFNILDAKRRAGACIVSVMHDINMAALYATRLVGLCDGHILFDGAVHDVFTENNLRALYKSPLHVFKHPTLNVPQACPSRIQREKNICTK